MMTNTEIIDIALRQSAIDWSCQPEDFLLSENVILSGGLGEKARRYYKEPITCNFVSYGNNIVASVNDDCRDIVAEYLSKFEFYHCFETPNLNRLSECLRPMGQKVCFMAEYYLPDVERLQTLTCPYELRVLEQDGFAELYLPEWSNALCEARKELDVLGVGAYDGGRLVGLAGCSADCDSMWQIGIDVLPDYRRQGIAAALTSRLASETLSRGIVPFYCTAWSNLRSVRNAIKCGFIPTWVEMTVKPEAIVDEMNK